MRPLPRRAADRRAAASGAPCVQGLAFLHQASLSFACMPGSVSWHASNDDASCAVLQEAVHEREDFFPLHFGRWHAPMKCLQSNLIT